MGDRSKGGGFDDVTDREGASTVGPEAPPPPSNEASSKAVPRPVDTPPELLLIGKHPEDVLAKIVDGDPLGLTELCTERIQVRAVFLEPTRLVRRTFARVAYEACRDPNRGKPTLHGWILARVDQALGELIAEDRDDEWRGVPIDPSHETLAFYHDIARKLLLEPSATRRNRARRDACGRRVGRDPDVGVGRGRTPLGRTSRQPRDPRHRGLRSQADCRIRAPADGA